MKKHHRNKRDRMTVRDLPAFQDLFPIGEDSGYECYDGKPPCVAGSETSEAAAEDILDHVGRLQRQVLLFIEERREHGATCDEVEAGLDMLHQTASARLRELSMVGHIRRTDEKRRTRYGREAFVYKAKP